MCRFRVAPWAGLHEETLDRLYEAHRRDLDAIVRCQERGLEYSKVYRDQYNLVLHGRGARVHAMVVRALRTIALAVEWEPYQRRMRLILDLSLHLNHRWLPLHPEHAPLLLVAVHEWNRPCARRWRRVFRLVRWIARMPKLLVAFNEVALRPGSQAARRAAARFKTHATWFCVASFPNDKASFGRR